MSDLAFNKLPTVSGDETVKALQKVGWTVHRTKGSHSTLIKPGVVDIVTFPLHRELAKGTLKNILQSANPTADEFKALL